MKDSADDALPALLPRGVHRERASYSGYVGYKAVTALGMLAAHLILLEELDAPERRPARVAELWEAIEAVESRGPRTELHIVA